MEVLIQISLTIPKKLHGKMSRRNGHNFLLIINMEEGMVMENGGLLLIINVKRATF